MNPKRKFTIDEARQMGGQLGVNQSVVDFAEFRRELKIELEHGLRVPEANSDAPLTGKIAWAHLKEFPDSYTRWTDSKPKRTSSRQRKGWACHDMGAAPSLGLDPAIHLTSTFNSMHKENKHAGQ